MSSVSETHEIMVCNRPSPESNMRDRAGRPSTNRRGRQTISSVARVQPRASMSTILARLAAAHASEIHEPTARTHTSDATAPKASVEPPPRTIDGADDPDVPAIAALPGDHHTQALAKRHTPLARITSCRSIRFGSPRCGWTLSPSRSDQRLPADGARLHQRRAVGRSSVADPFERVASSGRPLVGAAG